MSDSQGSLCTNRLAAIVEAAEPELRLFSNRLRQAHAFIGAIA
jgi:hypothetical protein